MVGCPQRDSLPSQVHLLSKITIPFSSEIEKTTMFWFRSDKKSCHNRIKTTIRYQIYKKQT